MIAYAGAGCPHYNHAEKLIGRRNIPSVCAAFEGGLQFRYHPHGEPIMSMIQLIYVSTANHLLSELEIRQILDSSIRHNTPQEVTGLLLYSDGSFMQVLEGDEAAVNETMSRIERDPLHHGIIVLERTTVTSREFGTWAMGFHGVTTADATKWPAYAPFFESGFDAKAIDAKSGVALDILHHFAQAD